MKVPPGDSEETCEGESRGSEMGAWPGEAARPPGAGCQTLVYPGTVVLEVGRAHWVLLGGGEALHRLLVPSLHLCGPPICQAGLTTVPVRRVVARPARAHAEKALRPLPGLENC